MLGLAEPKKQELRRVLEDEELKIQKDARKKMCPGDFESLAVIGRGAFGEVRLVRRKGKKEDPATGQIFALKGMKKEMMVVKNQIHHVKAERDALAQADAANQWLTVLHYSFFDESHLYMAMEFMPGGDLMSLLIKEDTFSESVTRFFMAEAAHAISSVHALGYIHRDIKPDNMLLDHRGHLKLTDLGLCKKVGEASPEDEPEAVLEMLRRQTLNDNNNNNHENNGGGMDDNDEARKNDDVPTTTAGVSDGFATGNNSKHRSSDDAMAMSIDDTPGVRRDAKTRREVRTVEAAHSHEVLEVLCVCRFGLFVCLLLTNFASLPHCVPILDVLVCVPFACCCCCCSCAIFSKIIPTDGLLDRGNPRLHCPGSSGRAKWRVRVQLHERRRLVVARRDHVRVFGRLHSLLRGRSRDHVPQDFAVATVPRNAGGNQGAAVPRVRRFLVVSAGGAGEPHWELQKRGIRL